MTDDELRHLYMVEGLSISEIAAKFGWKRSSMVGKLARIGCKRVLPNVSKLVRSPLLEPHRKVTDLSDRYVAGTCKWIEGDPRSPTAHWCGEPLFDRSWCEFHREIVFTKKEPK